MIIIQWVILRRVFMRREETHRGDLWHVGTIKRGARVMLTPYNMQTLKSTPGTSIYVAVGAGLGGVLVRVSSLLISFSSLSIPDGPNDPGMPRAPCLSNRYVSKFFFSSASPSSNAKRCASSRRTTWAAMMDAAADSRTTSDDLSLRD